MPSNVKNQSLRNEKSGPHESDDVRTIEARIVDLYVASLRPHPSRGSRRACLEAGGDLINSSGDIGISAILQEIDKYRQTNGRSTAASQALVSLAWINQCLISDSLNDHTLYRLITAQALLLDSCCQASVRSSIRKSAVRQTRANLSKTLSSPLRKGLASDYFATLLDTTATARNAPLIGLLTALMKERGEASAMKSVRKDILSFYVKYFLSSKTSPSRSTCLGLNPFLNDKITVEEVSDVLIPNILKAILRAPELVADPILSVLFASVLPNSDTATALLVDSVTKPLIGIFKSTVATTRQSGLDAFKALCLRSGSSSDRLMDQMFLAYSADRPGADQRTLIAIALQFVPLQHSQTLVYQETVLQLLKKETNEATQLQLIDNVLRSIVTDTSVSAHLIEIISKGIRDKKHIIRNQWLCGICTWAESDLTNYPVAFVEALFEPLRDLWVSDTKLPLQSVQNGFMSGTCALTVLLLESACHSAKLRKFLQADCLDSDHVSVKELKSIGFHSQIYAAAVQPFFMFTERIYTKISNSEELAWYVRALRAILKHAGNEWQSIADQWAKTVLSLDMNDSDRRSLCSVTSPANQEVLSSSLVKMTANKMWSLSAKSFSDSESFTSGKFLEAGLGAAFAGISSERSSARFIEELLLTILLLAHHPCLGDRLFWIEICQLAGIDPADVVRRNAHRMLQTVYSTIDFREQDQSSTEVEAALRASTTLAFVAPDSIEEIVDQISQDFDCQHLRKDLELIGAWHTPAQETFLDVVGRSNPFGNLKPNACEWTDEQWKATIIETLAYRKASARKLSKDEQLRHDTQLMREAELRQSVSHDICKLRRGIGLIRSLNKPFVETNKWFARVVALLTSPILMLSRPYTGNLLSDTLLACSARVKGLGSDARLMGLAILTTRTDRDQNDMKRDMINRVLYKLRFESERQAFDHVSFVYAQVLVNEVLCSSPPKLWKVTGCTSDEQIDEQIFLALEFINRNIALLSDPKINRLSTLSALVRVLENLPSQVADVRATVQSVLNAMSSTAGDRELNAIFEYFISDDSTVRNVLLASSEVLNLTEIKFSVALWLALHDDAEQNAELAHNIFENNAMVVKPEYRDLTLQYLSSDSNFTRDCAARALAHTFDYFSSGLPDLLSTLFDTYWTAAAEDPIEHDRFGQVIKTTKKDVTEDIRHAVARALGELSELTQFKSEHALDVAQFLFASPLSNGSCPMSDAAPGVRIAMLDVGNRAVRQHGSSSSEKFLPIFKSGLDHIGVSEKADWVREAAAILYGAAASYLAPGDERIPQVIDQLMDRLSTPSEAVQIAIAQCLPALVNNAKVQQPDYIHRLLCELSDGKSYGIRRGAAYGLSGVVKGCGISSLHGLQVVNSLEQAIRNKQSAKARQGALLAYECFAQLLGRLWEPYVQSIIPLLLLTFADGDSDVRSATQDTARAIMSCISGYGVQSILPSLLSGLEDHQWRSKKGSVELIGAMAYCAPKQLSSSLPTIIPRLNEVLTDSHAQVRAAGNMSLTRFGQVIKNPEIQQLVPTLLKALSDPNRYTEVALDTLLKTSFLHYIDSPSLSILIPILERGMQERVASTKKKSAKIFGLLASLTSPNDLVPHLASLVPCLRVVMIDTVPDVRATAAKALGSLAEKLGERNFPDIVDNLLGILNSDVASTDRQGAAQGLSEVLAGLGLERLEDTLPRILKDSRSRLAYVREGFISLLIYLPATFGTRFAPYLAKSIAPILAGLADESEFVRDASLRAGKIMIANYAAKSVDLMLPELERGVFNDSWRIRVSSLQLIGDLLFKVSGIATKTKTDDEDEDDAVATEAQRSALLEALGQKRRDRIFASLYIARFDSFALVRSSAINVWKALVANTPKTLKDILSSIIEIIIQNLSIPDHEKRAVYIETLGDLMRKMGRDLLDQLLPAFETGLRSSSADRIGVCVAITEVLRSGNSDQLEELENRLVLSIKQVLIDQDPEVRAVANETFESLQNQFGPRVIDRVLPDLLALLQSGDQAEEALEALKGLMQSRSHTILPVLLPGLLTRPMTGFNLQAVSSLARVAGHALTRRLPELLTTILDAEIKGEASAEASNAFETILLSTTDGADSVAAVMNIMLDLCKSEDYKKRSRSCTHLAVFFVNSKLDYSRYVSDWLRVLMLLLADRSSDVVQSAWTAQDALTKTLRKEEMAPLVIHLRRALQNACSPDADLAGFSLPKGLGAVLPILLQALLYGNTEQKEEAASGLGDVVQRTNAESLKIFVTQITGPLIRIIGERSGVEVKAAILLTLRLLIQKIPAALKPFLPQLQRSFTKSLADPSENVRSRAAAALGDLITLQTTRVDSLVAELVTGSRNIEPATSSAMLSALFEVIGKAGSVMSETSKSNVISLIRELSGMNSFSKAADLLGVLFKTLSDDSQARALLSEVVLVRPPTSFSIDSLNGLLLNSPQKMADVKAQADIAEYLASCILSRSDIIAERAIVAAGKFLLDETLAHGYGETSKLIVALTQCIDTCPSNSTDARRLSLIVLRVVAKKSDAIRPHMKEVGLAVFSCVRSVVLPVKLAAESTFVAVFRMAERQNELLGPFLDSIDPVKARSIGEYAKRVASKVAIAENERHAAGIVDRDDDIEEIMGFTGDE